MKNLKKNLQSLKKDLKALAQKADSLIIKWTGSQFRQSGATIMIKITIGF